MRNVHVSVHANVFHDVNTLSFIEVTIGACGALMCPHRNG